MNKIIILFSLFLFSLNCNSQALPANRFYNLNYVLEETTQNPSFAYSLRKLRSTYNGFAVRVRRSVDNAQADVSFDSNDVVSGNSLVTVTAVGTSSLSVGQVLSYNSFRGSATIFVRTWYDQGPNGYHATQTSNSLQPTLVLNSASPSNLLPSILFDGTAPPDYLSVGQPIQNITTNGINGSFMLVCRPTQNSNQHSFGTRFNSTNWRWSIHMNWGDGNCYFDASESCCATNRNFSNAANINLYRQYSFIRGTNYKTVLLNKNATTLNNATATSTAQTGGDFLLGSWSETTTSTGFFGNTSEVIMFPTDLSVTQISPLISNQMLFWGL